jgi:hypothetical protein
MYSIFSLGRSIFQWTRLQSDYSESRSAPSVSQESADLFIRSKWPIAQETSGLALAHAILNSPTGKDGDSSR